VILNGASEHPRRFIAELSFDGTIWLSLQKEHLDYLLFLLFCELRHVEVGIEAVLVPGFYFVLRHDYVVLFVEGCGDDGPLIVVGLAHFEQDGVQLAESNAVGRYLIVVFGGVVFGKIAERFFSDLEGYDLVIVIHEIAMKLCPWRLDFMHLLIFINISKSYYLSTNQLLMHL
jgi:hypothetical protein